MAVTRPRERSGRTCRVLREHGFTAMQRGLLRFEVDRELAGAANELASADWILLTSAEAVQAIDRVRRLAHIAWPASLRAACVGPATAKAAEDAGLAVGMLPEHYDGASLGAELLRDHDVRGARFFWPRAEAANTGLAESLRSAGAIVHDAVAYRTIPHVPGGERLKRDILAGRTDAVLFLSPSAVDAYMDMVGITDVVTGVLGGTSAERARAVGLTVHVQPETHTIRALASALRTFADGGGTHGSRGAGD